MFKESSKKAPSDALEMRAVFVPGHYFFCRRLELPEGIEDEELADFISLQLEGMSPFPLEHLYFGYAIDRAGGYAFAYAAYRRRFEQGETADWDKQDAVLPEFLGALFMDEPPQGEMAFAGERSISVATYDGASGLPSRIRSYPRTINEEGDCLDPIEDLAARMGDAAREYRILKLDTKLLEHRHSWAIASEELAKGPLRFAWVKRDRFWDYDIRDDDTLALRKVEDKRNRVFWKALVATAACFALLAVGELLLGGFALYASHRESVLKERQPVVEAINAKNRIATELDDFQDASLAPFAMLQAIEPFRPEVVYFSKVESRGNLQLEIDAMAPNQAMANQFKARIERSDRIENVEIINSQNQASGTRFTAILTFRPGNWDSALVAQRAEANDG